MKDAEIRCKNYRCNLLNENEKCIAEGVELPCDMGCTYHSDCTECVTDCRKEITEDGFILLDTN